MVLDLATQAEKEIVKGCKAKVIHSENMTIVHWNIEAGASMPSHSHPHEQVVNLIHGEFELTVGSKNEMISSGNVVVIPSNTKHSGVAITNCYVIDVFYPQRQDY